MINRNLKSIQLQNFTLYIKWNKSNINFNDCCRSTVMPSVAIYYIIPGGPEKILLLSLSDLRKIPHNFFVIQSGTSKFQEKFF